MDECGMWISLHCKSIYSINNIAKQTLNRVFAVTDEKLDTKIKSFSKNIVAVLPDMCKQFFDSYTNVPITYLHVEQDNRDLINYFLRRIVPGCVIVSSCAISDGIVMESNKVVSNMHLDTTVLDVYKNNKQIIKVTNKRAAGYLWHYCHFLIDCVFQEFRQLGVTEHTQIARIKSVQQSVGVFGDFYNKLLPYKNMELDAQNWDKLFATSRLITAPSHVLNRIDINGNRTGPFSMGYFDEFYEYIVNKFSLKNPTGNFPKIILIERGLQNLIYSKHDSGRNRRYIKNHVELKKFLENKYGSNFKNLMLENVDIVDQIRYFYNAQIVIAQHGAALSNVIWMKPGTHVVEIAPILVKIFMYITVCKGVKYHSWHKAIVDVNFIDKIISENAS
jgi:hypothetical protein